MTTTTKRDVEGLTFQVDLLPYVSGQWCYTVYAVKGAKTRMLVMSGADNLIEAQKGAANTIYEVLDLKWPKESLP